MAARFNVLPSASSGTAASSLSGPPLPDARVPGATARVYFVAAETVTWDYAPSASDRCIPERYKAGALADFSPLPEATRFGHDGTDLNGFTPSVRTFVTQGDTSIGHVYKKARFQGYVDATFSRVSVTSASLDSNSLLGPTMHAAAGDTLRIVFRNKLTFAVNLAFQQGCPLQVRT
jgi:hephaestin